jgi:hypothetical protein
VDLCSDRLKMAWWVACCEEGDGTNCADAPCVINKGNPKSLLGRGLPHLSQDVVIVRNIDLVALFDGDVALRK